MNPPAAAHHQTSAGDQRSPSPSSAPREARDCLLVANEKAQAVLALFPGSYEDPNEGLPWTRIVVELGDGDTDD